MCQNIIVVHTKEALIWHLNLRKYLDGEVTTGRSKTGQYIIFTPNNGDPAVRQDFCIISI